MVEQSQLSVIQGHQLPTISSKVMFWRPRYLAHSQWLQHIPFYFWLADALRPECVVEPNLNSAVSYFAICQAIDKLDLDTWAYAALGKNADTSKVTAYNHEHYREFSELRELGEAEFLQEFEENSIDLLLLKPDSELLQKEDVFSQLSQLKDNAVVLIHGTKNAAISQVCKTLAKNYMSFELNQGQGLLLLCTGKQIPERLQAFIDQGQDMGAKRLIQNVYDRLGSAHEDAWHRTVFQQQISELNHQLKQKTQNIDTRFDELATLTKMLTATEEELTKAKAANQSLNTKQQQIDQALAESNKNKQQLTEKVNQLTTAEQQQKITVEELTKKVTSEQEQVKHLQERLATLTKELEGARTNLQRANEHNAMLERDQQVAADVISNLKKSEVALQQALAEANQGKQPLQQQVNELTKVQQTQVSDNEQLKASLNKATFETKQLTEQLTEERARLQKQQAINAELTKELQELRNKCEDSVPAM